MHRNFEPTGFRFQFQKQEDQALYEGKTADSDQLSVEFRDRRFDRRPVLFKLVEVFPGCWTEDQTRSFVVMLMTAARTVAGLGAFAFKHMRESVSQVPGNSMDGPSKSAKI